MEAPTEEKNQAPEAQEEEIRSFEERFQNFLKTYKSPNGAYKYREQLGRAHLTDARTLLIDFDDLLNMDREIATEVYEHPDKIMPELENAARAQLKIEDGDYAERIKESLFHIRFRGIMEPYRIHLRKVSVEQVGHMIALDGIVIRTTEVKGLITRACFMCKKCGAQTFVPQKDERLELPGVCPHPPCKSSLFDFSLEQSTKINYQELKLQEKPEDLPPGQLPRFITVELQDDLVNTARPGDIVSASGIIRGKQEGISGRTKTRIFETYMAGNFAEVRSKEAEAIEITKEEEAQFQELAKDPLVHRKLISSIAPSIYGNTDVKEGLLYLLVGGVPKFLPDGIKIRGEINILLIGDPSVSKSQLLKYVAQAAIRGLYTSGRGSSAAGLTAAVIREQNGMALEAGALVLADKGIACIDEIDKMRPEDRVAMHEALEQHTVSVAKGGIVATLNARAAVLAAANPTSGRYNPYQNITENIQLPVTLLSRFDLIFLMRDIPEPDTDREMTSHIMKLHRNKADATVAPLPLDVLKKYIAYARRFEPVLGDEAEKALSDFYLKTRSASADKESPIGISARQLEALVRLSEARAKAMFRNVVTAEDAEAAIRLVSVVLAKIGVDVTTGKQDIDVIATGIPKSQQDKLIRMMSVLGELENQNTDKNGVRETILVETLVNDHKFDRDEARRILNILKTQAKLYSPTLGFVKRSSS
jgi:replicative DNA helicase Mcm